MSRQALGEIRWKDNQGNSHWAWFYASDKDNWGAKNGFPYEVEFSVGQMRYAKIRTTVVYICVDEDAEGKPVTEKWQVKARFYD